MLWIASPLMSLLSQKNKIKKEDRPIRVPPFVSGSASVTNRSDFWGSRQEHQDKRSSDISAVHCISDLHRNHSLQGFTWQGFLLKFNTLCVWSILEKGLWKDSIQICSKWGFHGEQPYCICTARNLGHMLISTEAHFSLRLWTSRDEASLWLVRFWLPHFDSQVEIRKTHITWMAAASDMMVHSVL